MLLATILISYFSRHPLSADNITVPIIRLEDVETADASDFDKSLFKEGDYRKGWSILSPKQFNSKENAYTSDHYSAIDNEYFKLTFPSTQKLIVNVFVDRLNRIINDINSTNTNSLNPEVIENEYVDYLVYGYDSPLYNNHVFAAKNGVVLHVEHCGIKGKYELIKAVVEFFNSKTTES